MILSVVVPCYNVEGYLDRCLTSLCRTEFRGLIEVLVVNDGSTDGTRDLALRYAAREPEIIRLIDRENGGHGAAVNTGMEAASGKYLRIVDGDDWVEPEGLKALLECLTETDAELVIDQKYEVTKETGEKRFFPLPEGTPFGRTMSFDAFCGDRYTEYYMLHTMNVRLDLLRRLGVRLLEHTFYVDFEYVLKVTSRAKTIEFENIPVYDYLVGNADQSVAPQNYVRRADQHRRVVDECLRFRRDEALTETMRAYVTRRCQLLLHTHLNILLIYDRNRKAGAARARALMRTLAAEEPELYALVKPRYRLARAFHALGVNDQTLSVLNRLRR